MYCLPRIAPYTRCIKVSFIPTLWVVLRDKEEEHVPQW